MSSAFSVLCVQHTESGGSAGHFRIGTFKNISTLQLGASISAWVDRFMLQGLDPTCQKQLCGHCSSSRNWIQGDGCLFCGTNLLHHEVWTASSYHAGPERFQSTFNVQQAQPSLRDAGKSSQYQDGMKMLILIVNLCKRQNVLFYKPSGLCFTGSAIWSKQ